jgi:hypothetical protein
LASQTTNPATEPEGTNMPPHGHNPHPIRKISGMVTDIFAHRFVLKTKDGTLLGDLTPHGAAEVELHVGDAVDIEGEQKPSEIKVSKITHAGRTIVIAHKPPKHDDKHIDHHPHADPAPVLAAAKAAGYRIVGEPRRKPRHFEVLGRNGNGFHELHIELDGHIRKSTSLDSDDHKWKCEVAAAARA